MTFLTRISTFKSKLQIETTVVQGTAESHTHLHIGFFTLTEANVYPGNCINNLIAVTSLWIEVDSENLLFAYVSK